MRPTRDSEAIGEVTDLWGYRWLVREFRATAHGFDVAIGWPDDAGRQGASAIMTPAVAQYLTAIERPRDIDLPIGGTTIKRLRAQLDLSFDWDAWWAARQGDLMTLTLAQFCAKHHCSMGATSQRRARQRDQQAGD